MKPNVEEVMRYVKSKGCSVIAIRDYFIITKPFTCVVSDHKSLIVLQTSKKIVKSNVFESKKQLGKWIQEFTS